ncbi:MAG TPA: phosphodiesterase [Hypericibacter adhaerens]|uniref:3',5'-cyclic adenosine monophosphate phosphodiesterase CpdA n=1 Tax=Hypericibacter adhaerens TaxID=2602016 RepID=A0A5J6MW38_9PROT|nr:phosphodiesterase [Hypericibacter adhaerens]QEX21363.1 3',5'-cyclic adenosine monophosphate phosphodiesterase CpdA [Hypericibacter adhaerens]HWA43439.1 phosphodiesterase [Hypericibacter adhaerens]
MNADRMLLAQISDCHVIEPGRLLFDRVDTAALLAAAVAHLNRLRPDFVWITGDLVDSGAPAQYAHLRTLLGPLDIPYALLPGNHDARGALKAAFADHACWPEGDGKLDYVIEGLPLRLIALDSLVPGEGGGRLEEEQLAWLDAQLRRAPARPTVIAVHHPPFATGIAEMDAISLEGAAALGAIVARHPQIERILCGHLHRPTTVHWQGTVVTTAPSTAHQVALRLGPADPVSWVMEPPALHLHRWQKGHGLVTHQSYIGDYGPTTPFG